MPKAYVYTLNLKGGNKYVGYTKNPDKRLQQHFSGNGAQWTQKHEPLSVNSIQKVSSVADAKKLEVKTYYKMKDIHGADKVRGAGNTSSVSTENDNTYENEQQSTDDEEDLEEDVEEDVEEDEDDEDEEDEEDEDEEDEDDYE